MTQQPTTATLVIVKKKRLKKISAPWKLFILFVSLFVIGSISGMLCGEISVRKAATMAYQQEQQQPFAKRLQLLAEAQAKSQAQAKNFLETAHFISPTQGEILCLGKYYPITWQLPNNASATATLKISEVAHGDTLHTINKITIRPVGNRQYKYLWKVGETQDNTQLIPNPGYSIYLMWDYVNAESTDFAGYSNLHSKLFTITTCQ